MKTGKQLLLFSAIVICSVFVLVEQAYAYLDPGTGSMIVQAVIAALAAAGVAFSVFRRKLRAFVGRILGKEKKSKDEDLSQL